MAEEDYKVTVHVYDLSNKLARQLKADINTEDEIEPRMLFYDRSHLIIVSPFDFKHESNLP